MEQTLFDTSVDERSGDAALLSVGQRFVFCGLTGQEGFEQRLPGSGSVGWVVELLGISPWGSLSVRCYRSAGDSMGGTVSVPLADAMAMIRSGVWQPMSE